MMNESNKGPHIYSFLLDNDISLFFWYSQLEGPSLLDLDMYIIHRKFWHLFFGAVGNYRLLVNAMDKHIQPLHTVLVGSSNYMP